MALHWRVDRQCVALRLVTTAAGQCLYLLYLNTVQAYHEMIALSMREYPTIRRFGEKLRTLRTQHGMTVRELTSALGYTGYGYIHTIEMGRSKPTAELVLHVALLFNVTTDQLLRDDLEV